SNPYARMMCSLRQFAFPCERRSQAFRDSLVPNALPQDMPENRYASCLSWARHFRLSARTGAQVLETAMQHSSLARHKSAVFPWIEEWKLVWWRSRNPAAACWCETGFGRNAHRDFRLPIGDSQIRRLDRKPSRRLDHGPVLLDLLCRFGPQCVGATVSSK